jgi:hypothetical protein
MARTSIDVLVDVEHVSHAEKPGGLRHVRGDLRTGFRRLSRECQPQHTESSGEAFRVRPGERVIQPGIFWADDY